MKLFIQDHIPLSLVYIFQLGVTLLIFWLDGYNSLSTILYACFLSTCLYLGYLFYRYATNRSLYKRLSTPLSSIDDLKFEQQSAPLSESFDRMQKEQIHYYQQELHKYKHRLDHHIQFINQWAHQMKTPLSVIYLIIQEQDDSFSDSIDEELDRLKKGLEMVLYSARLDTFDRDFYVETLDLHNIVRTVISSQKRLFIRNRVFPELQIEPSLKVTSDEKWLSFVITQILTNAVRYTVKQGEKIVIRGTRSGHNALLEIIDHGVGIPTSDLPRVFDPYFTGENGRNFQESTGMGLYLVKQICEKLSHRVEVESNVNQGTLVRIYFFYT